MSRITATHKLPSQIAAGGVDLSATSFGRAWKSHLSDTGSARIALQNTDPNLAAINYDDYIRFDLDGTPRFLMLVENIDPVAISPDEEFGQLTMISGRSALAEWEGAVVEPPNGVPGRPITETRVFNYAAPELDISGWSAAVQISQQSVDPPVLPPAGWFAAPYGWVDPDGYFIWTQATPAEGQPVGTTYMADDVTIPADGIHSFYSAADNGHRLWVDGVMISEYQADIIEGGAGNPEGYQWPLRADLWLAAGTHRIAVQAVNTDEFADMSLSIGGFIFALYSQDENGHDDTLIARSDNTWKGVNYPANAPGFTATHVIRILFEDAQADGELTDWTLDFTDTLDSNGNALPTDQAYSFPVGTDLLTVLRQLGETDIDFRMVPGEKTLQVYNIGTMGVLEGEETATLSDLSFLEFTGRA